MKTTHIKSYKDLDVWRRGMDLVREVYVLSRALPPNETFGLSAQLRRAAVSIPSNIAEGNGRSRRRDYIRLLLVARGSLQEVETQLLIASDLGYFSPQATERALQLNGEVGRMLAGLVRSLSALPQDDRLPR